MEISVYGRVQGVGFRPFTAQIAEELHISGMVQNIGGIVKIHAEGNKEALDEFVHRLSVCSPDGARVDRIQVTEISIDHKSTEHFLISASEAQKDTLRFLPPDIATCERCVKELFDRKNRRFHYPFISCTTCGPRFSIMEDVPYDRDTITMKDFELCPDCWEEYRNKKNIRRHAQTIGCHNCGPTLTLYQRNAATGQISQKTDISQKSGLSANPSDGNQVDCLSLSIQLLSSGNILAIKDIGGFHFAFDPENSTAANRLRRFKNRETKPFAIMFPDMESIRSYCEVSLTEEHLLCSEIRPIVLLRKKEGRDFVSEVCGDCLRIGAMLPCNPLQHLILQKTGPLVMTSGNRGGEPMLTEDADMISLMQQGVPDAILTHNREIRFGLDDSIYQVTVCQHSSSSREIIQILRRARGLVPEPILLPQKLSCDTFAAGGDLKAVFALGRENMAYLSGHFGDLENVNAAHNRSEALKRMRRLLGISPVRAVCDKHPNYISVRNLEKDLAKGSHKTAFSFQHHHAHIASVIAEHHLQGTILGIAYDGTGYGDDGTIWGGEFLLCHKDTYHRVGHLLSVPMISGNAYAKNTTEAAFCYLYEAVRLGYLEQKELQSETCLTSLHKDKALLIAALDKNIHVIPSSSMGRLFDAAAAILNICSYNSHEGEAPQKLQTYAEQYVMQKQSSCSEQYAAQKLHNDKVHAPLPFPIYHKNGSWIADSTALLAELYKRTTMGIHPTTLAYQFHAAVANMSVTLCYHILENSPVKTIALGGGTMYNSLLLQLLIPALEKKGFSVYLGEKIPAGDGGLAVGQLYLISSY